MNNQLINHLHIIGFGTHEAEVYVALLESGLVPAGMIVKKTGLHRNIIYETLDKLASKALVIQSEKRGVKQFKAVTPDKVLTDMEQRCQLTKQLVPQLFSIAKPCNVEVITYEGLEAFQEAHLQLMATLPSDSTIAVMGATQNRFYATMGNSLEKYDRKRKKQNIKIKILVPESDRDMINKAHTENRPLTIVRYLSQGFLNPSGTEIFPDRVFFQIYTDPVVLISIKSLDLVQSYTSYFEYLWNTAKE